MDAARRRLALPVLRKLEEQVMSVTKQEREELSKLFEAVKDAASPMLGADPYHGGNYKQAWKEYDAACLALDATLTREEPAPCQHQAALKHLLGECDLDGHTCSFNDGDIRDRVEEALETPCQRAQDEEWALVAVEEAELGLDGRGYPLFWRPLEAAVDPVATRDQFYRPGDQRRVYRRRAGGGA